MRVRVPHLRPEDASAYLRPDAEGRDGKGIQWMIGGPTSRLAVMNALAGSRATPHSAGASGDQREAPGLPLESSREHKRLPCGHDQGACDFSLSLPSLPALLSAPLSALLPWPQRQQLTSLSGVRSKGTTADATRAQYGEALRTSPRRSVLRVLVHQQGPLLVTRIYALDVVILLIRTVSYDMVVEI